MGLIASIMLIWFKFTIDSYVDSNNRLRDKVDKVYEFTTNHEVRLKTVEEQNRKNAVDILDLQLRQKKYEYYIEQSKNWNDINGEK